MAGKKINIELSKDEGLVLFELLSRFSNNEELQIVDHSEERVLWNIQAELEKQVTAPFQADYQDLLLKARERVRDR
ncbi:MAG: hypothetical protein LC803_08185 [Acidobacteria bacterium]|nr:hypothetical protein [Acidobacteriota bacterium]